MAGTREVVVPGTPYVIPYRLRSDRLEIIAVFHGRQSHVLNHVAHAYGAAIQDAGRAGTGRSW